MSYVALVGTAGAPGVTTAALALTLTAAAPVLLVEADAAGSTIAPGFLHAGVEPGHGLVGLAVAARRGDLADLLDDYTVAIDPTAQRRLLTGVLSPEQAPAVSGLWEPLARQLRYRALHGELVLVDGGRLPGAAAPAWPLLRVARQLLLVTRATLPGVASARAALALLLGQLPSLTTGAQAVGLVLVGDPDPYTPGEVSAALQAPVLGQLPFDPRTARVLHLGGTPFRGFDRAPLLRAARTLSTGLRRDTAATDIPARLTEEVAG